MHRARRQYLLTCLGTSLCPGRLLAESSILLAMAHLLCVFDIVPPPEGCDTQRLLHPTSFTSGVVRSVVREHQIDAETQWVSKSAGIPSRSSAESCHDRRRKQSSSTLHERRAKMIPDRHPFAQESIYVASPIPVSQCY